MKRKEETVKKPPEMNYVCRNLGAHGPDVVCWSCVPVYSAKE